MIGDIMKHLPKDTKTNINGKAQYQQDPAIFLKGINGSDNAIKIIDGLDLTGFHNVIPIKKSSANDFGGNFISSPANINNSFGTIFCFDNVNPSLIDYLRTNLIQNVIELKCSFRYNNERHIDECMTFMPYKDKYKVWIYKIRSITHSSDLQTKFALCDIAPVRTRLNTLLNINIPKESKDAITIILKDGSTKEEINNALRSVYSLSPIEVDCIKQHYAKDEELEKVRNIDSIKGLLEAERIINLNLISNELFGGSHISHLDKFIEFPIDLEITKSLQYKIKTIPIFNRIWYENVTDCYALFPTRGDNYDPDIKLILDKEKDFIGSIISANKTLHINNIDTSSSNDSGNVGGNLHCLVKMKY
jgi:hypothetical protein